MSEAITTTVLTCLVTLIGIFYSAKNTRDKVTTELDKSNALQQQEIEHIKNEIMEMKADIKQHNGYARLFQETSATLNVRLESLEKRIQ